MDRDSAFYQKAIEKSFLIVDKIANTVPFKLNIPQSTVLRDLKRRDIILKARQEGISSLILALFTVDFLTVQNIRCVVIAHEAESTKKLFDRVKFYLESMKKTFPGEVPYKLEVNTRRELINKEKNSTFYIGTAGAQAFGRGDTIHNLHCSELAFWPDQEKTMLGLMQSVPVDGRIIVETTANGIGDYFYNLWQKSQEPTATFTTHFLPWFKDPGYSLPIMGFFQLTDEETEIQRVFNLTNEQINWRRWKISELGGNLDSFNQEFPATAEEAFIVSGNPIWAPSLLKKYLHRCQPPKFIGNLTGGLEIFFDENPKGNLKIWQLPKSDHSYCIGADVAEGIESDSEGGDKESRRDSSCAYVMDRNTAEMVACWYGKIDGDQFGRQLEMLGRFYNTAMIGVERNYQGLSPLIVLRDLNYARIYYREKIGHVEEKMTSEMGWRTDRYSRPMMIDEGSRWLREERIEIYDEKLIGEMMSFVRYPDGQGRAAQGAHDDRVMSWLITIQMYVRNPHTESGNEISRGGTALFGGDQNEITSEGDVMDFTF